MKQKGFTIVELLVVIVVIGILASVIVVAYNGTSKQARNGTRMVAVKSAIESVEVALTKHTPMEIRSTLYSSNNSWYRGCIGTGYKDVDNNGVGDCGYYSDPYVFEVPAFTALLQERAGSIDMSGYPPVKSTDNDTVAGPYLTTAWVDSKNMLAVEYSLEGEGEECDTKPLIYKSGSTNTLTPPAGNAANYTKSAFGVTECMMAVVTEY